MIEVIMGGSGSGKSGYAERQIEKIADSEMPRYYIATMKVYGDEGRQRVKKHRQQRQHLDFVTIEQEKDISKVVEKMSRGKGVVLLECISNLVANEMFDDRETTEGDYQGESQEKRKREDISAKVLRELKTVKEASESLVVVTNNVFEDGNSYDEETISYMECLAKVNTELVKRADLVTEVVAGIPIPIKGGENP